MASHFRKVVRRNLAFQKHWCIIQLKAELEKSGLELTTTIMLVNKRHVNLGQAALISISFKDAQ